MARAKLHIICGNCGCNEEIAFVIDPTGYCDYEGVEHPAVFISCGNCATLHDLADTIKENVPEEKEVVQAAPMREIKMKDALESLTEIQYFSECEHKHRAWAWNALHALDPELADLSADNPKAAFDKVRKEYE